MTEPVWLRRAWVDSLHFQQLKRFGGLYGVRDGGAIESALARARNQWESGGEHDLAALAAAYGYGPTRSHGYSDGNKRVGFVAMAVSWTFTTSSSKRRSPRSFLSCWASPPAR